jgi:RNA polymerase sigma-B factor
VLKGLASAGAYSTLSLDAPQGREPDGPSVLGMPGAEDDALEGVENREALKPLPDRERRIFLPRFFAGMTQSQIAVEVGISQMHVSRLLARTLVRLPEGLLVDRSDAQVGVPGRDDAPASQLSSHSLRQARLAVTACSALR